MDYVGWRKVIVYVLTFLAYSWTGYGANFLGDLKDAVVAVEEKFFGFFENAITVARKIRDIHEVFDAAVEESCVFTCPGGATPKPNRNHAPKSNGCGPLGFEINEDLLPMSEMTKCCDAHDICYDTCNSDKDKCDLQFQRCLYKYCDGYEGTSTTVVKTCKSAAKLLYTGTTALGCKSYIDAQKESCYCGENSKSNNNKKKKWGSHAGGEL